MSYYFNDLMSNQPKLIDEKVQHDGLILLVFVSKNCQSGHTPTVSAWDDK